MCCPNEMKLLSTRDMRNCFFASSQPVPFELRNHETFFTRKARARAPAHLIAAFAHFSTNSLALKFAQKHTYDKKRFLEPQRFFNASF